MPPPYRVLHLEKLRDRGAEVEYPVAPWFEKMKEEEREKAAAAEEQPKTAEEKILEEYPVDRHKYAGQRKLKVERPIVTRKYKFKI